MLKSSFILSLVIASIAAVLLAMLADRRGFEEMVERATIAEQATIVGSKCPLSRAYIDKADIGLLSICLAHGLGAYEAAQRYPASAAKIFAVYGEDETFRKVFDQYGLQVIPVVAFFVENGSPEFQIRQALGEALQQMWAGRKPKWEQITREQIGLIAIHHIAIRGHEMLAEFEIVNGIAKRKLLTGVILGAKDLLLGGVLDVEKILVRAERLPTWKEIGLSALDVTIVAGGVGALAKSTRVGGSAVVEKSTGRLAVEGAYEAISAVGKTSKRVAPIALLYVAITRPDLLASAGGWIAEQFGIPRLVGILVVYFIGISLVLQLLWPLIWCGRIVGWLFRRLRQLSAHRPQQRLRAQAVFGAP